MRARLLGLAVAAVLAAGAAAAMTRAGGTSSGGSTPLLAAGPLRGRVEYVLALLNDDQGADGIANAFADSFLRAVPADQVRALMGAQLRPDGPFRVESVEQPSATSAVLVLRGPTGVGLTMSIAIDPSDGNRITGLRFSPVAAPVVPVRSWKELESRLRPDGGDLAMLAAEVVDGRCRPVHEADADRALPLGSAFKLYVLGALADEVAAGRASWDELVPIRDDLRVHSSAAFGGTPAGTEVPLVDLATAMISVSDNTATDHVMDRVGRPAVEAEQSALGMHEPAKNEPFLSTRELTFLKWVVDDDVRSAYVAGDRAARDRLLADLPARGVTTADLDLGDGPVAIRALEWFASPADLCRAHVGLQAKGEPVRSILSKNPGQGLAFDRTTWPYIAFKGGSEPGVLTGSWLARRADGRTFFFAVELADDHADIPAEVLVNVVAAFDLLAKE